MTTIFTKLISKATGISERQVAGTVGLLEVTRFKWQV